MDARSLFCWQITCCEDDVDILDLLLVEHYNIDAPNFFLDFLDYGNVVWRESSDVASSCASTLMGIGGMILEWVGTGVGGIEFGGISCSCARVET